MKKTLVALGVLLVALATALTVYVATQFKTTQQQTAEAEPPPPSLVTAVVEKKVLRSTTELICEPSYADSQPLQAANTTGQYTAVDIARGDTLTQGTLVGEVNGQPLFTVTGGFSFYRDLTVGDRGPDAAMMNRMLTDAGMQWGRSKAQRDHFDATSQAALNYLYLENGYPAPTEGMRADAFLVLSEPSTVVDEPRSTGAVADGPLVTVAAGAERLRCSAFQGEVTPEAASGQTLILPTLDNATTTISVGTETTPAESGSLQPAGDDAAEQQGQPALEQAPVPNAGGSTGARTVTADLPEGVSLTQRSIPATLVLEETDSAHLVVPSAAVWSSNGQTVVTVVDGDDETDTPVTILFSAGGENAVKAGQGATLQAGDQVKVAHQGENDPDAESADQ